MNVKESVKREPKKRTKSVPSAEEQKIKKIMDSTGEIKEEKEGGREGKGNERGKGRRKERKGGKERRRREEGKKGRKERKGEKEEREDTSEEREKKGGKGGK
ncbi:unnamed protein product [Rhizophagus irregularis]|nr:unnamed protein product [Rhizophagus irregularis]